MQLLAAEGAVPHRPDAAADSTRRCTAARCFRRTAPRPTTPSTTPSFTAPHHRAPARPRSAAAAAEAAVAKAFPDSNSKVRRIKAVAEAVFNIGAAKRPLSPSYAPVSGRDAWGESDGAGASADGHNYSPRKDAGCADVSRRCVGRGGPLRARACIAALTVKRRHQQQRPQPLHTYQMFPVPACRLWRLAWPLAWMEVLTFGKELIITAFVGRLGALELSALVLAQTLYNVTGNAP